MKNIRKEYIPAYLYYAASACFYIAASLSAFAHNAMTGVWLCLGSAFLCLGAATLVNAGKKIREQEEKEKNADKVCEETADETTDDDIEK
ncbi:MAG: hypothetical protein ACI3XL_06725 [Eubacteriales bacterium]